MLPHELLVLEPLTLSFCAFVPFCGWNAFFVLDQSDLFGERTTKLHQDFDQQIDLCEASASVPFRSKKEFKLDYPLAVRNEHHIVAPLIRSLAACLDVSLYVRRLMS